MSTTPQNNETAISGSRSVNSFDTSFNTPFTVFNKDITKSDNVPQQIVEKSEEKSDTDPFASFSNFKRSSTGKTDYSSTFSTALSSNNDITSESFATEFPSIEEIEASVESGSKIGFNNDFSSIPTNAENENDATLNSEVLPYNPVSSELESALPGNSSIDKEIPMEEVKDKIDASDKEAESSSAPILGEMSESMGGGLTSLKDSEPWISVEKSSESKSATQIDDFDAVFADLTDAKVTKTPPINFDADFDDTDFKEDFNPTFDAPVTHSKAASNTSSIGSNMGVTSSINSTKNSSTDFDKFGKAFGDFDPFSSSATSNATKPNLVDAAFGGISGEPQKSTNPSIGFEDAFEELLLKPTVPSTKTELPLDPKSTTANDSKTSILSEVSQPKVQSMDDDDDDVEQVKRLRAMGFSREKVIDALGRYDYDIEKASNFLLENL
ncbi:14071_t:CDS:1 [Cetraspora pellucida]|uniref:14071_t:CDS:1 n=1 Tax=Cetraspora pellucida TaxID=1433469 RepID=A0ACA9LNY0_9GLOM|nr:14071_t:CDS:1 [Cetraspora pellucida]